jgi:hypothetical protein
MPSSPKSPERKKPSWYEDLSPEAKADFDAYEDEDESWFGADATVVQPAPPVPKRDKS